jgi:tripartite-type tricarboxylate transporter receptor subunit TctC
VKVQFSVRDDIALAQKQRVNRRKVLGAGGFAGAHLLLASTFGLTVSSDCVAQTFPSRPIKLIVGYPPGGSGDFVSRVTAEAMSRELGVQVLVENRPGAAGVLASDVVAKATPDGYTILNAGTPAVLKALYKKLPYNPETDFAPISLAAVGAMVICVNNDLPVKSVAELIAYGKANPGKLLSAASGNGSAPHLASARFEVVSGVKFTTVQYKGGSPAAVSVMAGETQVMFATAPTVLGFIKAGRMRALALTTAVESPSIPGIQGAKSAGLSGYDEDYSFGLYAPAQTPPEIIRRLHDAALKGLSRPEVRDKFASQGMDAAPSKSPEAFRAALKEESKDVERRIAETGARIE